MYDISIALKKGTTARGLIISDHVHTVSGKKWKLYKQHVERENVFKNAVVLVVGLAVIVALFWM
jgi:hypothetical protein